MLSICCWCGAKKDNQWGMCGECYRFPITTKIFLPERTP